MCKFACCYDGSTGSRAPASGQLDDEDSGSCATCARLHAAMIVALAEERLLAASSMMRMAGSCATCSKLLADCQLDAEDDRGLRNVCMIAYCTAPSSGCVVRVQCAKQMAGTGAYWARLGKSSTGFLMDKCAQKKGAGERESDSRSQRPAVTMRVPNFNLELSFSAI
eukprot:1154363-Pelagomonas_calceolata.AAC.3